MLYLPVTLLGGLEGWTPLFMLDGVNWILHVTEREGEFVCQLNRDAVQIIYIAFKLPCVLLMDMMGVSDLDPALVLPMMLVSSGNQFCTHPRGPASDLPGSVSNSIVPQICKSSTIKARRVRG